MAGEHPYHCKQQLLNRVDRLLIQRSATRHPCVYRVSVRSHTPAQIDTPLVRSYTRVRHGSTRHEIARFRNVFTRSLVTVPQRCQTYGFHGTAHCKITQSGITLRVNVGERAVRILAPEQADIYRNIAQQRLVFVASNYYRVTLERRLPQRGLSVTPHRAVRVDKQIMSANALIIIDITHEHVLKYKITPKLRLGPTKGVLNVKLVNTLRSCFHITRPRAAVNCLIYSQLIVYIYISV